MFHSALLITCLAGVTLAGVIPGPTLVRLPAQDSAVIQHERLGGNFAYSAHEAHAYGVQTPVVEQRVVPQGFSFVQGTPQVRTHTTVQKHLVPQYGVVRTQHTVPVVSQVQVSAPIITSPGVLLRSNLAPTVITAAKPSHVVEPAP